MREVGRREEVGREREREVRVVMVSVVGEEGEGLRSGSEAVSVLKVWDQERCEKENEKRKSAHQIRQAERKRWARTVPGEGRG